MDGPVVSLELLLPAGPNDAGDEKVAVPDVGGGAEE